jgi:predicted DNA-binding transcriptional regulator AlpA
MESEPYKLVKESAALEILGGISRATLWRMIRAGICDPPIKLGPKTNRWRDDQLYAVVARAEAVRGAKRLPAIPNENASILESVRLSREPSETPLAPQAGLFGERPSTPIARRLEQLFADGGSMDDGVRLAQQMEQEQSTPKSERKGRAGSDTFISDDWLPSDHDVAYALAKGLDRARIGREVEKFRTYYKSVGGYRAKRRDWSQAFRNWIIKALEMDRGKRTPGAAERRPTGGDAVRSVLARATRALDQAGMGPTGGHRSAAESDTPSAAPRLDFGGTDGA